MKKTLCMLIVCGLFAHKVEKNELINISKTSKVLVYTNLF